MPAADAILPPGLVAAWFGVVGAALGSFVNVVIARVPAGESIVRPRSRCPACRAPIAWYDNVPIVSWLVLRARCRRCGAPISARYPLVEALVAAAAVLAWRRHGLSAAAAVELALVATALALAFIDLDTWLLPHALTWPLLVASLAASAARLTPAAGLRAAALGAAIGFAAFALVSVLGRWVLRKEALGFGDVWLLAGLGGWLGVGALLPVVLLASIQGSVVGLVLLALGKGEPGPPPEREAEPGGPAGQGTAEPGASGSAPGPDDVEAPEGARHVVEPGPAEPGPAPATAGTPERPEDGDWVPPRHAVPFGPFLVAGALEWLYLGRHLARALPLLWPFVQ